MLYDLSLAFIIFISYSFIGKIGEIMYHSYHNKRFTSRGYFIGPYIPIWGAGALLLMTFLKPFIDSPLIVFFLGTLICVTLEYSISYFMEKVYQTRWWDYSDKKFNLHGRVCLEFALLFGISTLLFMYYFNPIYMKWLSSMNANIMIFVAFVIFVLFAIDSVVSLMIVLELKRKGKLKGLDCTEAVKREIRKRIF